MPRKPPYKKMVEVYLERCRMRNLSEGTIREYFYILRKGFDILRENNLNTNPKKIREREAFCLLNHWNNPTPLIVIKKFLKTQNNNIFDEMEVVFPNPAPRRSWLSEEEAQLLIATCQNPFDRMLVHLELELGFRRIEVARAKVDHFKGNEIVIHGKGRGGGKYRTISKHEGLTDELLNMWYQERDEMLKSNFSRSDYLMIYKYGKNSTNYRPNSLDNKLRKILNTANLTGTHHTLRRTFGRLYYEATGDIVETSNLLGHESVQTTMRYIGVQLMKQKVGLAQLRQKLYPKELIQTII